MVVSCDGADRPAKPPSLAPATKFSDPFVDPSLRWGATRLLRCQLPAGDCSPSSAAPSPPAPPPPATGELQAGTSLPPPQDRPRLLIRIPCRPNSHEPERMMGSSAPRPGTTATANATGGASPEAPAPEASLRRSQRPRFAAVAKGEERPPAAKKAKVEFHDSLSKAEIEADFIAMTSHKPPRHLKRHPKSGQSALGIVLPGVNLPKIVTPDRYWVPESSH